MYNLSMQPHKERLTLIVGENEQPTGLEFDPQIMSLSSLREMVTNKVRSIENTTIFINYPDSFVCVDSARLHEIHRLPQQQKTKAIRLITNNIACADRVLIYSLVPEHYK